MVEWKNTRQVLITFDEFYGTGRTYWNGKYASCGVTIGKDIFRIIMDKTGIGPDNIKFNW